jgi:capsular exopolysaccharide synthesis family protein
MAITVTFGINIGLSLLLSLLAGITTGITALLIREHTDDCIKCSTDLRQTIPLPLLGVAPNCTKDAKQNYAFLTAQQPASSIAGAFRTLRHNVLLATQHNATKIINITSTDASEGKSSTSINLAAVLAQEGKTVLLIDSDLRRPTLHKHFKLDNTRGFGNYLAGLGKLENLTQPCSIPGLYVIPAGPITHHSVELLSSGRLKELLHDTESGSMNFDMIVIDSPPVMGLADALLISSEVHATLLVVASHQTRRKQLRSIFNHLQHAHTNLIGTVLTKASC